MIARLSVPASSQLAGPPGLHCGAALLRVAVELLHRFLQVCYLGSIVDDDVHAGRIRRCIILMILFGDVEFLETGKLSHDGFAKESALRQLVDIGGQDSLLSIVPVEDRRPVLRTCVGTLAVELRRIVGDGKKIRSS